MSSHDYKYYDQIRGPSSLGMSGKGTFKALGKNIDGLKDYIKILIEGDGRASKTGSPPGNSYFVNTNAKCKDVDNNKEVDRYMYIDNQPSGSSSFVSGGMGMNFSSYRGLLPGILDDMIQINPERIMDAFMESSIPKCKKVRLKTIGNDGESFEEHAVPLEELKNISPCMFSNRRNPETGKRCEGFTGNMRDVCSLGSGSIFEIEEEKPILSREPREPRELSKQLLIGGSGLLMLYLLYCMLKK